MPVFVIYVLPTSGSKPHPERWIPTMKSNCNGSNPFMQASCSYELQGFACTCTVRLSVSCIKFLFL